MHTPCMRRTALSGRCVLSRSKMQFRRCSATPALHPAPKESHSRCHALAGARRAHRLAKSSVHCPSPSPAGPPASLSAPRPQFRRRHVHRAAPNAQCASVRSCVLSPHESRKVHLQEPRFQQFRGRAVQVSRGLHQSIQPIGACTGCSTRSSGTDEDHGDDPDKIGFRQNRKRTMA